MMRGLRVHAATLLGVPAILVAVALPTLDAAQVRRKRESATERVRAKPPTAFEKSTVSIFFPDAFATLEGERPDFKAVVVNPGGGPTPVVPGDSPPTTGGRKWSALISPDTLTDEVKEMKATVSKAVGSAGDFKGGGYDEARVAFSSIAMCFGIIVAYDGDVRWKKEAETARDLFARAGVNCKVGTQQSLDESKARLVDLEALIEGGAVTSKPDREEEFRWSGVAGRPPLMKRLDAAEAASGAAIASKDEFNKQVEKLLHEVEVVAAIAEVIQQPDFEYHDDDTYRGYASQMRDAAVQVRDAAQKSDYDAARTALGALKKSCEACHGDYRS